MAGIRVTREHTSITNQSNHFRGLSLDAQKRYEEKISVINGRDPYCIKDEEWNAGTEGLPETLYYDIVNYLVFEKRSYTSKDFKSYRSLEAFNQFKCGCVQNLRTLDFGEKILISGKVHHSQKMSKDPLNPWIIANKDGSIFSDHCECMAGLGQTCNHVAAVLFYIEEMVRLRKQESVTDVPAYIMPYAKISDIDFTNPKRKSCIRGKNKNVKKPRKKAASIPQQTEAEFHSFLSKLHATGYPSVILSVVKPYCDQFVPVSHTSSGNSCSLFEEKNLQVDNEGLVKPEKTEDISE